MLSNYNTSSQKYKQNSVNFLKSSIQIEDLNLTENL